jgi:riboflavin transporter FmnP
MNTREVALTITFTALTIVLDSVRIPSVYLVGVNYRFCEIPIVAAFLLLGPKIGVSVAVLNVPAEMLLFPGPGALVGPPIVIFLTLSMLLGIYSALRLLARKSSEIKNLGTKPVRYFTAFGVLFRTGIAPFVLYPTYRFLLPLVGVSFSHEQVMMLLPALMLYALTFSVYTIPIGYLVARTVSRNLKVGNQL